MSQPAPGIVGQLWSVTAGFGPVTAVATAVLSDSRAIAVTDGSVRLWDPPPDPARYCGKFFPTQTPRGTEPQG